MAAVPDPEVQFAQRLASNEKPIRTRALKKLRKYINLRSQKSSGGFTSDEVLKLWKGLFYCLWMQDKPLLQEELSHQISSLIHSFQDVDGQIIYVRSFLQTFKREWTGLDRLRMDKFFQLVRFMFRKTFEMLQRRSWDSSVVSRFLDLLTEQLLQGSSGAPCGLQLHILDLYLSELAAVGSAELTADQNLIFIEPFCKTAAKTKDRTLFSAICRSVFSAIIEQAPFAIEDLMKEVKAAEASDPGSGQSSDDEDKETGEKRSNIFEKKTNGIKSNDDDDDHEELLHLEDSDTEAPCDGDMEPVLQFDYAAVAEKLFALSSRSDMPSYNRKGLYKIIRVLRNLSEGVFPEDEYPEEVSTDEDDDMFGSRKKMKRGRGLMEGEEGPPESKRSKGNKKEPSADMNNNDENKKKRKKKKKKKAAEAGESTNSSEKEQNSVNVSENATAEDQSETPLQEPPSLLAREEPDQPTAHTTDTEEKSETKSKRKTSGLKIAEEQQMIPSDAGVSEKKKMMMKKKKKKKNQIGSETQVSARDEAAPSENGTTKQAKKNAEENLEVNGVSLEEDSTTSGKKKSKKKKKPMSDEAEKVEAKNTEPETTPAAENPSADATAAPPVKKKKTKQEKNSLEAADEGSVPPLKKKKRKKQEEPTEEQHITKTTSAKKKASSAKHEVRDQDPAQDAEVPLEEPEKPAKKKRKIPVVFEYEAEELEASINGAAEEERAGEEDPPPATPLSSRKSSRKAKASGSASDFITFQSNAAVPTPLFCRTKGGPLRQRRQTPKSDSKKVTFGLKNNKTAEFKKNDRSLLVSPDGSSRVPFDPKQKPKFGVLKSPSPPLSAKTRKPPKGTRKAGATVPKARPKARPTAADFF